MTLNGTAHPPADLRPPRLGPYVVGAMVAAIAIGAAGYQISETGRHNREDRGAHELQQIAALKAAEVAEWRGERLADARVMVAGARVTPSLPAVLAGLAPSDIRRATTEWMSTIQTAYGYVGVAFADASGRVQLTSGLLSEPPGWYAALVAEALAANDVVWRRTEDAAGHFVLASALRNAPMATGTSAGAVILEIDPAASLALVLQPPGNNDGVTVRLTTNASTAVAPRPPLGSSAPIPGTNWRIDASRATADALAPTEQATTLERVVMAALIALVAAMAAAAWRWRVATFYRQASEIASAERAVADRYDAELRLSRERLDLALDAANEGHWDWRADGAGFISERYHAMLGYPVASLQPGREGLATLVHPDDRHALDAAFDRIDTIAVESFDVELRLRTASGGYRWILSRGKVVTRLAGGAPARIVGTHMDVTDRRTLEDQLHQSQKLECLGRLAGGVAHDFNNLLTVINGYGELMAFQLAHDPNLAAPAAQILKAGRRAVELTHQLLAFSRKQITQPRPLSLNALITDSHGILSRLVGANIPIVFTPHAQADQITADAGQIHQVLINLVVNARDAMPSGGMLTIATHNGMLPASIDTDGDPVPAITLTLTDTGGGMDEATLAACFEPFFTTKAPGHGTGLGLSTVYGIVRQNHGAIQVTSAPNAGTTITVSFPQTFTAVPQQAAADDTSMVSGSETVMLVEDQPDVRTMLAIGLRAYGYRVLEAANAAEAIAFAADHADPIDVLATDVMLPGMNGRDLAQQLRQTRPDLKALFMSGYSTESLSERGLLAADVPYIQKPFRREELAARIRALLTRFDPPQHILVVDDDDAIRALFLRVLTPLASQIMLAAGGAEAIDLLDESAPVDLLITDLMMPDMDGVETIARIRGQIPGVRVIAVTGAADEALVERARTAGAEVVLRKPIEGRRLNDAIVRLFSTATPQ